ncbi:testis-specific serine kinase substrate isoform 2-T2 [Spheniscus humboldti]
MEPCVTSTASVCEVKVTGGSPPAVPGGSQTSLTPPVRTSTSRAMANAGVKTLLQSKEIREAMDPTSGTRAQPAAPRPLLGAPQALTKPAAASFLGPPSAEFPRSSPPSNCCSLKRTLACTNLLLLSLADADDAADEEASPGPRLHTPCPKDSTQPTAPPSRQEHSSAPPRLSH